MPRNRCNCSESDESLRVVGTETWLPKSWKALFALPATDVIYEGYTSKVFNPVPGIIVKCTCDLLEEVHGTRYAHNHLSLHVPMPRILYHPRFPRCRSYAPPERGYARPSGVWYMCMQQCSGVSLDKVIDSMTPVQLDHVADQLKSILSRMSTIRPKTLGSVTGGPYRNFFFPDYVAPKHAFTTIGEFNDHIRWMLMLFCTEQFTESVLCRFPRNAAIRFAHADLLPKNIMVDGSTITGVIDWATAGFYPEYWEYARMHDPHFMTPAWDDVLRRLFPTPRRQTEIEVVRQLMSIVAATF
ncbi:kinase-like domain-containing protein [Lyophyllum atratum]|nr:kinase-like domain-containing protein [Lyophyllum atratum]